VLIQYWYEVAKHPVKAIDKVFVDNVRQTSGFTAYTGQEGDEATGFAGRAMVKFTTKPVIRKQVNIEVSQEHGHGTNEGSHNHSSTSISTYQKSGVSASGGSQVENATNAIDGYEESYCNMFYAGPGQINLGLLSVTLEGGNYGEMVKIEAVTTVYRSSCGCRIRYGAITWDIPAGAGGGDYRFTNSSARTWNEPVIFEMINRESETAWIHVHEISMIYYYYPRISNSPASGVSTSVSTETILGGLTTADVVIGDEICCDVRGYQDDGSGTYTGTANALIQRPDHVFKHMLVALLKQSAADIGTTLAASGAVYAAKTYRLAFLVHDIGTDGQQIFHALAAQCRSIFYEWGGKFELQVLPDSAPESSFTVEARDIIEQPTFNFSGSDQIRNRISAFYRRDYRGSRGRGNSLQAAVNPDALARGYMDVLETFQTPGDLQEDLLLSAVRLSGMAQSVMDYRLARRMRATMDVELRLKWRAMSTSPGSYFAYDDPMFGSSIYRVVEFRPDRSRGSIFVMGRAGESAVVQGGLITFTAPDLQIIYNDALVIADGLMTMAGESPKIFLGYPIQDGTLTLSNDAIAIAQNHNLVVQDGTLSFNDPYISFGEYAWEISSTELVPSDAASPIGAWEVSDGNLIPIDTPDFDDLWEVSGGNFIPKS
jgi:hypothetical protein